MSEQRDSHDQDQMVRASSRISQLEGSLVDLNSFSVALHSTLVGIASRVVELASRELGGPQQAGSEWDEFGIEQVDQLKNALEALSKARSVIDHSRTLSKDLGDGHKQKILENALRMEESIENFLVQNNAFLNNRDAKFLEKLGNLQESCRTLQIQLDEKLALLETKDAEMVQLNLANNTAEKEKISLQERIDQLKSREEELVSAKESALEGARQGVDRLREEKLNLQRSLDELEEKLDLLRELTKTKDAVVEKLTLANDEIESDKRELGEEIVQLKHQQEELLSQKDLALKKFQTEADRLREDKISLERAQEELEEKMEGIREQYERDTHEQEKKFAETALHLEEARTSLAEMQVKLAGVSEALRNERNLRAQDLSNVETERQSLAASVKILEQENDNLKSEVLAILLEKNELLEKITILEEAVVTQRSANNTNIDELESLRTHFREMESRLSETLLISDELRSQISSMKLEMDTNGKERARLDNALAEAVAFSDLLQGEKVTLLEDQAKLKASNSDLELKLSSIRARLLQVLHDAGIMVDDHVDVVKSVGDLLVRAAEESEAEKQQAASLRAHVSALEEERTNREASLSAELQRAAEIQEKNDEQVAELKAYKMEFNVREEALHEMMERVLSLENDKEEADKKIASLSDELASREEASAAGAVELSNLRKRIDSLREKITQLQEGDSKIQAALEMVSVELETAKRTIEETKDSLKKCLKEDIANLQSKGMVVPDCPTELEISDAMIWYSSALELLIERIRSEGDATSQIKSLLEENERLSRKIEVAETQIASLVDERETSKQELDAVKESIIQTSSLQFEDIQRVLEEKEDDLVAAEKEITDLRRKVLFLETELLNRASAFRKEPDAQQQGRVDDEANIVDDAVKEQKTVQVQGNEPEAVESIPSEVGSDQGSDEEVVPSATGIKADDTQALATPVEGEGAAENDWSLTDDGNVLSHPQVEEKKVPQTVLDTSKEIKVEIEPAVAFAGSDSDSLVSGLGPTGSVIDVSPEASIQDPSSIIDGDESETMENGKVLVKGNEAESDRLIEQENVMTKALEAPLAQKTEKKDGQGNAGEEGVIPVEGKSDTHDVASGAVVIDPKPDSAISEAPSSAGDLVQASGELQKSARKSKASRKSNPGGGREFKGFGKKPSKQK
uniref:Uncharacterized protein n=1 Tax=Compsopogon caeruleus TaxID=31354 RepID=A0A7S1TIB8_9RHOD